MAAGETHSEAARMVPGGVIWMGRLVWPPDSPLCRPAKGRRENRAMMINDQAMKVGREAAVHQTNVFPWRMRGYAFCLGGIAFATIVGIVHPTTSAPVLLVGEGLVLLGGLPCFVMTSIEQHRYYRATSKALGIPISSRAPNGPPPRHKDKYLRWCERRNQRPWPFAPPGCPGGDLWKEWVEKNNPAPHQTPAASEARGGQDGEETGKNPTDIGGGSDGSGRS